jgi:hypothetical protein
MTTEPTVRCNRCRRVLSDPRWCAVGLGRVCAARLGLVLRSELRRRIRVRAGGGVGEPVLDGLAELMEEIDESEGTWVGR